MIPGDDAAWYYAKNGQPLGPFSLEQLRQLAGAGVLQTQDLVYGDGSGKWVNVANVPVLRTTLPPVTAILALPPSSPPALYVATAEPLATTSPVPAAVPVEQQTAPPGKDPTWNLFAAVAIIAGIVGGMRGTLPALVPWLIYGTLSGTVIGYAGAAYVLVLLRKEGNQHVASKTTMLLRVPFIYSALGFAAGLVLGLVFGAGNAAYVTLWYGALTGILAYGGVMGAWGVGKRLAVKFPTRADDQSSGVALDSPPVQIAERSSAPQLSLAAAASEAPELLYCPLCSKQTDSLRTYSIIYIFFLVFFIAWGSEPIVACPQCLRRHLLKRSLNYLLPANLFWPILAFSYLLAYFDSGGKGHSLDVAENYQPYTAPRPPSRPATIAPKASLVRLAVTVLILAAIVIAVYVFTS